MTLVEGRNLPSGGIANLSNPYCVLSLGSQLAESRRNNLISIAGNRGNPVWNQDFHFLVEDSSIQRLVVHVRDSPMTFRTFVGGGQLPLSELQDGRPLDTWIPITDGKSWKLCVFIKSCFCHWIVHNSSLTLVVQASKRMEISDCGWSIKNSSKMIRFPRTPKRTTTTTQNMDSRRGPTQKI